MESACAVRACPARQPRIVVVPFCWQAGRLASNPSVHSPPTPACLCVVHPLSPPGWGRRHWAEPGPSTDCPATGSISLSGSLGRLSGDRDAWAGNGDPHCCSGSSKGPWGSMGSRQSSPKSQTHQQGSHLLISLERSGVKNC